MSLRNFTSLPYFLWQLRSVSTSSLLIASIPDFLSQGVKLALFIYCFFFKNNSSQVEMLWEDHRNDLFVNSFGTFPTPRRPLARVPRKSHTHPVVLAILTAAGGAKLVWCTFL